MDYPRVTEILKPFTHYDQVPKNILDRAAARGTSVHALCASIAKGAWVPETMIDTELAGYVGSFVQWMNAQVKKFLIIERRYIDEDLGFTGQLDFVVEGNDNRIYLVDLKTGKSPQKTYPVQMAAYEYLLDVHGVKIDAAMLVYLDKEGEFPNVNLLKDLTEEHHVFFAALDCYEYFNKKKKKKKKDEE